MLRLGALARDVVLDAVGRLVFLAGATRCVVLLLEADCTRTGVVCRCCGVRFTSLRFGRLRSVACGRVFWVGRCVAGRSVRLGVVACVRPGRVLLFVLGRVLLLVLGRVLLLALGRVVLLVFGRVALEVVRLGVRRT